MSAGLNILRIPSRPAPTRPLALSTSFVACEEKARLSAALANYIIPISQACITNSGCSHPQSRHQRTLPSANATPEAALIHHHPHQLQRWAREQSVLPIPMSRRGFLAMVRVENSATTTGPRQLPLGPIPCPPRHRTSQLPSARAQPGTACASLILMNTTRVLIREVEHQPSHHLLRRGPLSQLPASLVAARRLAATMMTTGSLVDVLRGLIATARAGDGLTTGPIVIWAGPGVDGAEAGGTNVVMCTVPGFRLCDYGAIAPA